MVHNYLATTDHIYLMIIQSNEEKSFLGWMRETGNIFTGNEYHMRFGIWLTNKRRIQDYNKANLGFILSLNKFAHFTESEYKSLLGFKYEKYHSKHEKTFKNSKIHTSNDDGVDWRMKGVINPIQDQLTCGSCWAFSAIQAQESQYAITYNILQKLSEQNLVDCVTTCEGCDGCLMDKGYDYVINSQSGKFMLEADYPYESFDDKCRFDSSKATSNIVGIIHITEGDEIDLADKVRDYGPAAIAIDASHFGFQFYKKGIYDEQYCDPHGLDHGVGCVGYGTEGMKAFWIVRNSWGTTWGENGYIRMIKDKNNQCGEASMASIPIVQ